MVSKKAMEKRKYSPLTLTIVAMFMKKTFTPVQELGRRYMNSWKDGTQADFFTRFMASAQRGDGLFLLRDSLRRMMESMTGSDDKKNGGNDHK
jgi:hypothetical protein